MTDDNSDEVRIVMPAPLLFVGLMQRLGWELTGIDTPDYSESSKYSPKSGHRLAHHGVANVIYYK